MPRAFRFFPEKAFKNRLLHSFEVLCSHALYLKMVDFDCKWLKYYFIDSAILWKIFLIGRNFTIQYVGPKCWILNLRPLKNSSLQRINLIIFMKNLNREEFFLGKWFPKKILFLSIFFTLKYFFFTLVLKNFILRIYPLTWKVNRIGLFKFS